MLKLFTKYYKKILTLLGVVFILSLNFAIFRFQSYAIFRDYIIVRDQDFTYNNINPLSVFQDFVQNSLLRSLELSQISTLLFSLIFSFGLIVSFGCFWQMISFCTQISYSIFSTNKYTQWFFQGSLSLFLAFLLTYNPFTLERFFMGQDRIIFGNFLILPYICLIIQYLYLLNTKDYPPSKKRFYLILLVLINLFLVFVNIHSLVFTSLIAFIASIIYFKKTKIFLVLTLINTLFIILCLIMSFNILNLASTQFYLKEVASKPEITKDIVSAFSLQVNNDQNLLIRGLIGSGSWNTPGFIEIKAITTSLDKIGNFSLYANQFSGIFYLVFLMLNYLAAVYFLNKTKLAKLKLLFVSVLPLMVLFFSFGYSSNFTQTINSIYYNIPGSYIFREAGKSYYLFFVFAILAIFLVTLKISNKSLRLLNYLVLLCVTISGFLPFTAISANLNYVKIPVLLDRSLNMCQSQTLATLPSNLYIVPDYSKVFIVNPLAVQKTKQGCKILRPQATELVSRDRERKINLGANSDATLDFDIAISKYESSLPVAKNGELTLDLKAQKKNTVSLYQSLKRTNIDLLLIDKSSISYSFNLINDLSDYTEVVDEDRKHILLKLL